MFLNALGRPAVMGEKQPTNIRKKQFIGPLLVTPSAFKDLLVPEGWCRCIFGTASDLKDIRKQYTKQFTEKGLNNLIYRVLNPYKTIVQKKEFYIKGSRLDLNLTLLLEGINEFGENVYAYLVETRYMVYLLTDELTGSYAFVNKVFKLLRKCNKRVNVLFINDFRYTFQGNDLQKEKIQQIRRLISMVKPKSVYGLSGETLAKCLRDLSP